MDGVKSGYWLYWSGVDINDRGADGLGLIITKDKDKNLKDMTYATNDSVRQEEKEELQET